MRPDDGPEADALAPRRPPEPIAVPIPVVELVTVERWCPNDQCAVDSWTGLPGSVCGCRYPGVDRDEATLEGRRRIVAELGKAARNV